MKLTVKALGLVLAGALLLAFTAPAGAADDKFCPMGGMLVKIAVDKDKALDWAKSRRKMQVTDERADTWTILTLSRVDDDIALVLTAQSIFFGVAGRDRDVDARAAEKVFGRDFRKLKEAVKKEIGDLWKDGVVKMGGDEVQKMSDAAGLGVLEKDRRDWELKTEKCEGKEVDTSRL